MWGRMTSRGMGYMCKIERKMKQALCLSILQDEATKLIEYYRFHLSPTIFQYDNDPKHTTKLVRQWVSMQNFDVLTWPPRSLDLNPMEHL